MGNVNEYEKLSDLISKSRNNIQFLHNYFCIKCRIVDRLMVKVGAVVFCKKCHEIEFGLEDKNPVMNQRPKYLKWLKKYLKLPYGG